MLRSRDLVAPKAMVDLVAVLPTPEAKVDLTRVETVALDS